MNVEKILLIILVSFYSFNSFCQINQTSVEVFIEKFAEKYNVPEEYVAGILDKATYQSSIIDRMNRPAEKSINWDKYRNIFIQEERIQAGVNFWKDNKLVLEKVSTETGVPIEIILGIIGVESYFGKIKGNYLVLDALYTLSFGYPKREKFFSSELEAFLVLSTEENIDVYTAKGSYAGAIGYCQFMPSSYRAYAKSFDPNGTRDLINSADDAISSVANYLKVHRWETGGEIATKVTKNPNSQAISSKSLKPDFTSKYYFGLGYEPVDKISENTPVTLIQLENDIGNEYWFGMNNFYVITRYNHSSMYALVVYQLGEAIKKRMSGTNSTH